MWLKDTNGAIYRVDAITAVVPLEFKDDRRDQTKVTRVHAAITTVGGHTHNTTLDFDDVVKVVEDREDRRAAPPASKDPPAS
jgi:hypothetical protein